MPKLPALLAILMLVGCGSNTEVKGPPAKPKDTKTNGAAEKEGDKGAGRCARK